MAVYSAVAIGKIKYLYKLNNRLFISCFTIILIIILFFQIRGLQYDPIVAGDVMNTKQELSVKEASIWLNNYMHERNIKGICVVPGELVTDKVIRRIWMYLPGDIGFFATGEKINSSLKIGRSLWDLATLRMIHQKKNTKCIFISKEKLDKNVFVDFSYVELINEYPDITIYLYLAII